MSGKTGIEWTDRTWNPVVGCTKVSQGCKLCYAKTLHDMRHKAYADFKGGKLTPSRLFGRTQNPIAPQYAQPFETVQLMPDRLTWPLSLRKPSRIFVNSVSDLFHEDVPDAFIALVFAVMFLAERHVFQVLTKRPERMRILLSDDSFRDTILDAAESFWNRTSWAKDESRSYEDWCAWLNGDGLDGEMPGNIWLGVSVENQEAADERIPLLLQTPAAIRFLSCEPLLGPIQLHEWWRLGQCGDDTHTIDWVICGGESGSSKQNPRPMDPTWARSLRDQCIDGDVPFLFKQWGEYVNIDPPGSHLAKVGKKRAGRELDGRTWDEYPVVAR